MTKSDLAEISRFVEAQIYKRNWAALDAMFRNARPIEGMQKSVIVALLRGTFRVRFYIAKEWIEFRDLAAKELERCGHDSRIVLRGLFGDVVEPGVLETFPPVTRVENTNGDETDTQTSEGRPSVQQVPRDS